MRNWRFWERDKREPVPEAPVPAAPSGRFNLKPRTDLPGAAVGDDPARADQLTRLRSRRDAALFDVEQAELAKQPENAWRERVALIDQTLAIVVADLAALDDDHGRPGSPVPAIPIEALAAMEGPPPAVSFGIGTQRFRYEEDLDWAERGFQLARSDLQLREGSVSAVVPPDIPPADRAALEDHLANSLFVFASDMRDRLLAGEPLPNVVTLTDLARPSDDEGGWLDWAGNSPEAQKRQWRRQELAAEQQRLLDERTRELDEEARWAERLPIALRRLRDVDKEIAALEAPQ